MARLIQRYLVFLFALGISLAAVAQEDVEDYRRYKFYDEDEGWWWQPVADTLLRPQIRASSIDDIAFSARYQLGAIYHSRWGEGFDREYRLVRHTVDYTTASLLRSLGCYDTAEGIDRRIAIGRERELRRAGHFVRAAFTGRGLWGGITHRGIYRPTTDGLLFKDGWQIAHYARVRTGRDIYIDGIAGNAVDLAINVVRRTHRSNLTLIALMPWSERAMRSATTAESFMLAGDNRYNPAWGMQEGRVRSSRMATTLHPQIFADYTHRLSLATSVKLNAHLGIHSYGRSGLTWFNTPTPLPDNYRYMPSMASDEESRLRIVEAWQQGDMRYTQIDWQALYRGNAAQSDGHALYAVDSRRYNIPYATLTALFTSRVGRVDMEYGVAVALERERRFRRMDDLLGASHIVDLDYFLEDDDRYCNSLQNNLREPNRKIEEGDRYGYDYNLSQRRVEAFVALDWQWGNMALSLDASLASEALWRRGHYEKELFRGAASYGRSRVVRLMPYSLATEWRYEHRSHAVAATLSVAASSPEAEDIFLQADYNNRLVDNPRLSHRLFASLVYGYARPGVRVGVRAFLVRATNIGDVIHYYDDHSGLYADAAISDIGYLNMGIAADAEFRWARYFRSTLSLTVGRYRHSHNPMVAIYSDADNMAIAESRSAMAGLRCTTPAFTALGDVEFVRGGWGVKLAVQAWCGRYVEASPIRRMVRFTALNLSPEERDGLVVQHRLPGVATADITLERSVILGDNKLIVELAIRNILGTDYIARGYEHHRVRSDEVEQRGYLRPFDDRLLYGYPRTFAISALLLF